MNNFNMTHNTRKNLLGSFLDSKDISYKIITETEYPRYSVFRVKEDDNITQYQIFKDGSILKNCYQIVNWREAEAILKATA